MFNFFENFQSYSNIELLKIVKRPNEYQPDAVAAAKKILTTRNVSEEELDTVTAYFIQVDSQTSKTNETIQSLKDQTNELLEPILQPSEHVNPTKWLNIIILVVTLQYISEYIKVLSELRFLLTSSDYHWDISSSLVIILLVYIQFVIYLLWKRKRWGWILLFSTNIFSVISLVMRLAIYSRYNDIFSIDPSEIIIPLAINLALIYVLFKKNIAQAFNVNEKSKKEIAIIVIIGTLTFSWFMSELSWT